jgi:hypothetical protein
MPPAARKTVEKPTETVPVTEALADDVAAESATFEPGTPRLLAHLEMPRLRRADAYGALGAVQAQNEKYAKTAPAGPDDTADGESDEPSEAEKANAPVELSKIDPTEFGERYKIVGLIEEYLAVCAADEAEFRNWALSIDDQVLVKTFNVYMKVNQPGEANSSAS